MPCLAYALGHDLIVLHTAEIEEQRQYRNSLIQVIESEGKVLYEQS